MICHICAINLSLGAMALLRTCLQLHPCPRVLWLLRLELQSVECAPLRTNETRIGQGIWHVGISRLSGVRSLAASQHSKATVVSATLD